MSTGTGVYMRNLTLPNKKYTIPAAIPIIREYGNSSYTLKTDSALCIFNPEAISAINELNSLAGKYTAA